VIARKIGELLCWIGWHRPIDGVAMAGINLVSVCRRCNRQIMQDSNGGWF
jgi:hypothetical protein